MSEQQKTKAHAPVTTHVVTTPNRQPPTQIDVLKNNLTGEYMKTITNYFLGDKEAALAFMSSAVDYVRRVPKLLECDRQSLLTALVTSAQFKFMPSGASGEAYIIPYKYEAKFQLGYQGIVTLLYRSGKVSGITSNIIYKNDKFEYEEGLQPILVHKPAMFGLERGEVIGVYTVALMKDGSRTFKVMDSSGIMAIKNLSKAKDSKESPWNSTLDPEMWMWKKTCLIQHAKLLPKTAELQQAIEKDYEGEGIDKGRYDAGGPAVAKAFHTPDQGPVGTGDMPEGEFKTANQLLKERQQKELEDLGQAEVNVGETPEVVTPKPVTAEDIAAYEEAEQNEKEGKGE